VPATASAVSITSRGTCSVANRRTLRRFAMISISRLSDALTSAIGT